MENATVTFFVKGEPGRCRKVLLGVKKKKVGARKWNGPGGRVEPNESVLDGAIRESVEEAKIQPYKEDTKLKAIVHCFRDNTPYFDVYIYECDRWSGKPTETQEMGPFRWYHIGNLPIHQMMEGDVIWVSEVLKNPELREVWIYYDSDMKLIDHKIMVVDSL